MGLPLFVAPVESDLPSKASQKVGATTSPPRSSIRRPGWRDRPRDMRRGPVRLYGHIPNYIPSGSDLQSDRSERDLIRNRFHHRRHIELGVLGPAPRPPAADSNLHADTDVGGMPPSFMPVDTPDSVPRPFRESLSDGPQGEDRRRENVQDLLNAGLRAINRTQRDAEPPLNYLNWFSREAGGRERRTRSVATSSLPIQSRYERSPDRPRPNIRELRPQNLELRENSHDPTLSEQPASQRDQAPYSADRSIEERIRQINTNARRARRQQALLARSQATGRSTASRRSGYGVDGLGDRERSLSPQGWDTLLSTLTPDPQAPSASSSFASAAASQSAGPSSTTTPPTVDASAESLVENPCESGCEGSDVEDDSYVPLTANARAARLSIHRQRARNVIDEYNLDGPADGPLPPRMRRAESHDAARSDGNEGPLSSSRWNSGDENGSQLPGMLPLARLLHSNRPPPQDGWVGQLSVGASDEDQAPDGPRLNREDSVASGQNASTSEEDLLGMQRIIRSLSWRQDIPEDWWAEVGLRRTLPPDTELS